MNTKNKELLYELYLRSLDTATELDIQLSMPSQDLPRDAKYCFQPMAEPSAQVAGSIVILDLADHEIWCMINQEAKNGTYEAYKLSPFTGFACEYDIWFQVGSSGYMLETDNRFLLNEQDIAEGIKLYDISLEQMTVISESIRKAEQCPNSLSTDLDSPENKFRIKEHELTLPFRSRQTETNLWIPQIALQYRRNPDSGLAMAAADSGLDEAFRVLQAQQDENVYYAREFTLHKNESHDLLLSPDQEYISRKAEIRCGEVVVYRGILPPTLTLARFLALPVSKAQQLLQITISLIRD